MRFIIMHETNAHWESGASPEPELVARVGGLLGQMAAAGALEAGEGLRPSSTGVRMRFAKGARTVTPGPFPSGGEVPAGFTILRGSLEQAVDWASRQAEILGDGEVDIRPVTEPWDIGMAPRPEAPVPRLMVLRKATSATEAGASPSPSQRQALGALVEATSRAGQHLVTETIRPTARGRRYKNSRDGISVVDGPFTESKELIGGYVIVSGASLDAVDPWVRRYIEAVGAEAVDVRELD